MDARTDGWTAALKNNIALSHPYHEGKWCSKSGWIPFTGLGGDSLTDRWMDDGCIEGWMHGKNNVALAHPYHEGKLSSKLGRILPSGLGGDSMTYRQMDRRMYGWKHSQYPHKFFKILGITIYLIPTLIETYVSITTYVLGLGAH